MRRTLLLLIVPLVVVACGRSAGTGAGPAELTPVSERATGTSSPEARPPVPTTSAPSTTTSSSSSTTSSSTVPVVVFEPALADERLQDDLAALVSFGVREAGSPAEQEAAEFLRSSLETLSAPVEVRAVPLPTGRDSANVLATFGDGDLHVLLGAHYDSKPPSPGADDNASGTAVLLELARRLDAAPRDGLRVTIVFFGAEEILIGYDRNSHHYGSRLLAEQMAADGDLPDAMVSADMVGVGSRIVAATYFDADPRAADLIVAAAAALDLTVVVERRGDISDHEAFARHGVPSVFLWRPDNPNYHLATDVEVRTEALLEDVAILEAFLDLAGVEFGVGG